MISKNPRGGSWKFRIQDTLFDSNSASNVLVHLLADFEEFMVCWSSFGKATCSEFRVPFGKCIYKPFQLGQGEKVVGRPWNRRRRG